MTPQVRPGKVNSPVDVSCRSTKLTDCVISENRQVLHSIANMGLILHLYPTGKSEKHHPGTGTCSPCGRFLQLWEIFQRRSYCKCQGSTGRTRRGNAGRLPDDIRTMP